MALFPAATTNSVPGKSPIASAIAIDRASSMLALTIDAPRCAASRNPAATAASVPVAPAVQHADGHDPGPPRQPGRAKPVVAARGERSGDSRPVTVLVDGVVVAVDLVAREHVVDGPVAVVVDAVVLAPATGLTGVVPEVRRQIRVAGR